MTYLRASQHGARLRMNAPVVPTSWLRLVEGYRVCPVLGRGIGEEVYTCHGLSSSSQLLSPCSVGGVSKVISVKVKQDLGYVHLSGMLKIPWAIFLTCKIRILMPAPRFIIRVKYLSAWNSEICCSL